MSKAQVLRELVKRHLTAAVEEICGLFEVAIAELEEEMKRQRSLPEGRVEPRRTGTDVYSLDVRKETFRPEQQIRTFRSDQEEAKSSDVKEKHKQLQAPQEFHPVRVKNEKDEYFYCSLIEKKRDFGQESCADNKITSPSEPETKLRCEEPSKAPLSHSDFPEATGRNSSEKAVCCSACGKIFSKKSNLKTHMRIHTGEKPFGCTFCNKRFVQKVHLRHHMTRHTGEKPLGCSTCDQRFNWLYQLKNHQCFTRNSLSCHECSETFTRKSRFKERMQPHTAENTSDAQFAAEIFLGISAAEMK